MDKFAGLDEETKARSTNDHGTAKRSGTITEEEAQTQLAELGVEMPERGEKNGQVRRFR